MLNVYEGWKNVFLLPGVRSEVLEFLNCKPNYRAVGASTQKFFDPYDDASHFAKKAIVNPENVVDNKHYTGSVKVLHLVFDNLPSLLYCLPDVFALRLADFNNIMLI